MSEAAEEPGAADEGEVAKEVSGDENAADGLSEFIESLAAPISADAPCGESVRYDDDFEQIKSEGRKRIAEQEARQ